MMEEPSLKKPLKEETVSNDSKFLNVDNHDNDDKYYEQAEEYKLKGNAQFSQSRYEDALSSYNSGLSFLSIANDKRTSHKFQQMEVALRSNKGLVLIKLNLYGDAVKELSEVLEIDPSLFKALFRRAMARENLTPKPDLDGAQDDLQKCIQLLKEQNSGSGSSNTSGTHTDTNHKKTLNESYSALHRVQNKLSLAKMKLNAEKEKEKQKTSMLNNKNDVEDKNNNNIPTTTATKKELNLALVSNFETQHETRETEPRIISPTTQSRQNSNKTTTAKTTKAQKNMNGFHHSLKKSLPLAQPPHRIPSPQEQKQIILQLLHQSSSSNKKLRPSNNNVDGGGEAYYVICAKWWSQWCHYTQIHLVKDWRESMHGVGFIRDDVILSKPKRPSKGNVSTKRKPIGYNKRKSDKNDNYDSDSSSSESSYSSDSSSDSQEPLHNRPGIIDNTELLNPVFSSPEKFPSNCTPPQYIFYYYGSDLRPHLVRGHHYDVIPREVYSALRHWYKDKTPYPILRRTTTTFNNDNVYGSSEAKLYLYPSSSSGYSMPHHAQLALSANNSGNFLYNETPPFSYENQPCGACGSPTTKACTQCNDIFYCSQDCQTSHWPYHKQYCISAAASYNNQSNKSKSSSTSLFRKSRSSSFSSSPTSLTRLEWQRCGLNNLGNTCFLNSAVQCLAHVKTLSLFFLTNHHLYDVNIENPLGNGGRLASAYETSIKDMYFASQKSISPSNLKRAIATYAPRFAGCQQHDAQEFLAYLLDGLHEDLNRVCYKTQKKKYVEMPDIDGKKINSWDMQIKGAEVWDIYRLRNDSLVMDTFYGQFKSTCVCPLCERVSVAFDSYNHISLEIPQNPSSLKRTIPIIVYRPFSSNDSNDFPALMRYAVKVDQNNNNLSNSASFVSDIKYQLEKLTGIHTTRMMLCDVYENAIFDILKDNKPTSTIRNNDVLLAYDVDPYDDSSFHALCTHFRPTTTTQGGGNMVKFGYPLVASFHANINWKELWNFLWQQMKYLLQGLTNNNNNNSSSSTIDYFQQKLQIRLVDPEGKPRENMPVLNQFTTDESPILGLLGENATENFLFLSFEWDFDIPPLLGQQESIVSSQQQHHHYFYSCFDTVYSHKTAETLVSNNTINNTNNIGNAISLDQCISTFTQPERLDENNKWYCSSCKKHVRALKTMELWKLPEILIIHLKRFKENKLQSRIKLDTHVDFPLEGLDLRSYCRTSSSDENNSDSQEEYFVQDEQPPIYDLFAVINHFGRMGYGHYTAYARRWKEEQHSSNMSRTASASGSSSCEMESQWAVFDDSSVGYVEPSQVISPAAYVLFYKRRRFNNH